MVQAPFQTFHVYFFPIFKPIDDTVRETLLVYYSVNINWVLETNPGKQKALLAAM